MSSGKRYEPKRKLNMKKVLGVIVAIVVITMIIISIKRLLEPKTEKTLLSREAFFSAYKDEKWGVIDSKGNEVIPFEYDEMILIPDSSKDIFITITNANLTEGTYQTKVLNKNKEEIYGDYELVEPIDNFDVVGNLWYERNVLKVRKEGKYGLINFDGNLILDCSYDSISSLKGLDNSLIIKKESNYGLVSNTGDIIVKPEYKNIQAFGNNYEDGYIVTNIEDKQGLIGSNKKEILPAKYEQILQKHGNDCYVVKESGILKIINSKGETILENQFDDVIEILADTFILKRGDNVGVVNTSGEELIPFTYQNLKSIGNNGYIAQKDNLYGVIDLSGNTKIKFEYDMISRREGTNFLEAEKNITQTDIYDNNLNLKLSGIVSEVNAEKGYISIRIGEEQKYYNFKFEEKTEQDIFPEHTLFLAKNNGKYGYKNKNGELIVDYIYDDAKPQNNYGYCSVKKGNVWGCLNDQGNIALEPSVNLDNNLVIDFIGKWHLAEDLNMYYYEI